MKHRPVKSPSPGWHHMLKMLTCAGAPRISRENCSQHGPFWDLHMKPIYCCAIQQQTFTHPQIIVLYVCDCIVNQLLAQRAIPSSASSAMHFPRSLYQHPRATNALAKIHARNLRSVRYTWFCPWFPDFRKNPSVLIHEIFCVYTCVASPRTFPLLLITKVATRATAPTG